MCEKGLVHIYCGDGKGKTSAAVGLAIRAAGAGKRTVFAQFLKDNQSSELNILRRIKEIQLVQLKEVFGFYQTLTEPEKKRAEKENRKLFEQAVQEAKNAEVLVLDEIMAAMSYGLLEKEKVLAFLEQKPEGLEVVLTGRNPPKELVGAAHYISEIRKKKHPYDVGIAAREGIEF